MNIEARINVPNEDVLIARPSGPLTGEIQMPGDKSVSHRALILGALAHGESRIEGLLESDDVLRTLAAVRSFGARAERTGPGEWRVRGGTWTSPDGPIDCGNSGTSARLLLGAAAGFALQADFTGDPSLCQRPMERVVAPLRRMGITVEPRKPKHLPFRMRGHSLTGIRHKNEFASAQVKSAVLLAGLRAAGDVEVVEPRPSRNHCEGLLRLFGCEVLSRYGPRGERMVCLGYSRHLRGAHVQVPGDPSSAAFPLVAALITPGSDLILRGVMLNPTRSGLFETLREMGASLRIVDRGRRGSEQIADLIVRGSGLRGVRVPAKRAPSMIDEYPILAVAAAFARGLSVFEGLAELRVKECDRLQAIVDGLTACGVKAAIVGDDLLVEGDGNVRGAAAVKAQGDHRIAMAFLTLGLGAEMEVGVDSGAMIATSFPGFCKTMRKIGADITPR